MAFISRWLWCSLRYLTHAFYSRVFGHAFHNSLQFGITAGFTEIDLSFATPRQRTTDNGVGAVAGIMELRTGRYQLTALDTFYTLSTKNITTLLHYILRTTDNGQRSGYRSTQSSQLIRLRSTIAHYSKLITKNIHAIAKPANSQQPKANSRLVVC